MTWTRSCSRDREEGCSQGKRAAPREGPSYGLERQLPLPRAGGADGALCAVAVGRSRELPAGAAQSGDPLAGQAGHGGPLRGLSRPWGPLAATRPSPALPRFLCFLIRAPGPVRLPPCDVSQGPHPDSPWPPKPALSSSTSLPSTGSLPCQNGEVVCAPHFLASGLPGCSARAPRMPAWPPARCHPHSRSWHLSLCSAFTATCLTTWRCASGLRPPGVAIRTASGRAGLVRPCCLDGDTVSPVCPALRLG